METIQTANNKFVAKAFIYDDEQKETIQVLIQRGYIPHHTAVGRGRAGIKRWKIENYSGKYGKGFKMITTSPYSRNFNHITYFINNPKNQTTT